MNANCMHCEQPGVLACRKCGQRMCDRHAMDCRKCGQKADYCGGCKWNTTALGSGVVYSECSACEKQWCILM